MTLKLTEFFCDTLDTLADGKSYIKMESSGANDSLIYFIR